MQSHNPFLSFPMTSSPSGHQCFVLQPGVPKKKMWALENSQKNVGNMGHTELHRDPAKRSDNMETPEKDGKVCTYYSCSTSSICQGLGIHVKSVALTHSISTPALYTYQFSWHSRWSWHTIVSGQTLQSREKIWG